MPTTKKFSWVGYVLLAQHVCTSCISWQRTRMLRFRVLGLNYFFASIFGNLMVVISFGVFLGFVEQKMNKNFVKIILWTSNFTDVKLALSVVLGNS